MRHGRLQPSTLSSILRALNTEDEDSMHLMVEGMNIAKPRIQKQYIPQTSDSPLYRLMTVMDADVGVEDSVATVGVEDTVPTVGVEDSLAPGLSASGAVHLYPLSSLLVGTEDSLARSIPNIGTQVWTSSTLHPQITSSVSSPQLHATATRLFPQRMNRSSVSLHMSSRNVARFRPQGHRDTSPATAITTLALVPAASNTLTRNPESKEVLAGTDGTLPRDANSWKKEYEHIDVDWSMQAMDVLYSASFYDYIRDESNIELSSIRLIRIIKDYRPKQVAGALRWMIQGWTVESTSKLLRTIFADWLPDLAGCVYALVCQDWPKKPQTSLCTAYLLLTEPASSVALFIRTLTELWSKDDTIDMISYLDSLLEVHSLFSNSVAR